MDWFDKIKTYYNMDLWNIDRVKNAVVMGKITEAQFTEITGQEYVT